MAPPAAYHDIGPWVSGRTARQIRAGDVGGRSPEPTRTSSDIMADRNKRTAGGRTAAVATPTGDDRVAIEAVAPQIDGGRFPVKFIVGDTVDVSADIFIDGHERISAELLSRHDTEKQWQRSSMKSVENDRWAGNFEAAEPGRYLFSIEAWRDPFTSWHSDVAKKRAAGQTIDLELVEGAGIVSKTLADAPRKIASKLRKLLETLSQATPAGAWKILDSADTRQLMADAGSRLNLSALASPLSVRVDRERARFSAWYELFPRSASNSATRHGSFDNVIAHLPYVQEMGFDVLYFPPIHPIGTANRKGINNTLGAEPGDVGSVYAIGSAEGGHDATHPELGTKEDFRRLVTAAREHDLEIALDFAIQCSPDHPWIKEHPDWFDWRPDGTIKFAENPPKKYEDIVNVHFYRGALPYLWLALRDIVLFWLD